MRDIFDVAWHRFSIISSIISDANARIISVLFYFTILVPFGIGSTLLSDPLRRKVTRAVDGSIQHPGLAWIDRDPVPNDLDSARQQG